MAQEREQTVWKGLIEDMRKDDTPSLAERAYVRYWAVFNELAPPSRRVEILRWFELPGWMRGAWENTVDFVAEELPPSTGSEG